MRLMVLCVMFFLGYKTGFCQSNMDTLQSCSTVVKSLSYFWKIDSSGSNGFRFYAYERILSGKIDAMTSDYLLEKFGKPNETIHSNKGFEFLYYVLDSKKLPKEYGHPFECWYISFVFDEAKKRLLSVDHGVLDY